MTTDRELLELAAKAVGIAGEWVNSYGSGDYYKGNTEGICYCDYSRGGVAVVWNPITDDGDALRLAVKLELIVSIYDAEVVGPWSVERMHEADKYEATRRAIVRASAEIGSNM